MNNVMIFNPDKLNGYEIMDHFIHTNLHVPWLNSVFKVKLTVCVGFFEMKPGVKVLFVQKNEGGGGKHAEESLIEFLNIHKDTIQDTIKVFLNYSPCNKEGKSCSSKFLRVKNNLPSADLSIRFAGLHRIIRPSCKWRDNAFRSWLDPNESAKASWNLWKLGSSIRSFVKDDWNELIKFLSLLDDFCGRPCDPVYHLYEQWRIQRDLEDIVMRVDCSVLRRRATEQPEVGNTMLRNIRLSPGMQGENGDMEMGACSGDQNNFRSQSQSAKEAVTLKGLNVQTKVSEADNLVAGAVVVVEPSKVVQSVGSKADKALHGICMDVPDGALNTNCSDVNDDHHHEGKVQQVQSGDKELKEIQKDLEDNDMTNKYEHHEEHQQPPPQRYHLRQRHSQVRRRQKRKRQRQQYLKHNEIDSNTALHVVKRKIRKQKGKVVCRNQVKRLGNRRSRRITKGNFQLSNNENHD